MMDNPSSGKTKVFAVLFSSTFVAMLGIGIIVPLLPVYADSLGASGLWMGMIFSGFALTRSIFMPFLGRMSDTRGRKVFIVLGLILYTIFSILYIRISTVYGLAILRLFHGFAAAMVIPITVAYIGDISAEHGEGKAMGTFNVALFAGFGVGPLIGGILSDSIGFSASFYTMGLMSFIALVLVTILLPELGLSKRRIKGRTFTIREVWGERVIKGLLVFRFVNAVGRGALACFLPIYAVKDLGLSGTSIGILISSNILLTSILQVPAGALADKLDRKKLIITGSIIASISLWLMPHSRGFIELLLKTTLMGIGGALAIPAAMAIAVDRGREYGMGSVMGSFSMAMDLGLVIGTVIGGMLFDKLGLNPIFYFASLTGVIGTLLFIYYLRFYTKKA